MCGGTRRDNIRNQHIRGTNNGASVQENYRKTTEVVRPCEENERGAHSEKNVRCGHTGEKKKRTAKPTMEKCMQERHDRRGSERGQHDKQGRMEEEAINNNNNNNKSLFQTRSPYTT